MTLPNIWDANPAECGGADVSKLPYPELKDQSEPLLRSVSQRQPVSGFFVPGNNCKMSSSQPLIEPEVLADLIRDVGKPLHINQLTRAALTGFAEFQAATSTYAPGDTFAVGETIQFNGSPATVTAINKGFNPQQGHFQILTLTLGDGSQKQMAAGIEGASTAEPITTSEVQVDQLMHQEGLRWRTAVHETLSQHKQFIHFQNEQGDHYCLFELMPSITEAEIQQVWAIIETQTAEPFQAVATETLVAELWGMANDGSNEYHLFTFALNAALQTYREVQYVLGAGWMLREHWQQLAKRPSLIGPRKRNIVPEPTAEPDEEEAEPEVAETEPETAVPTPDIEAWRQQRRQEVTFTLKASHYYHHWLPLNHDLQRLFPPFPGRVTFHHWFGSEEGQFTAVVNPDQQRILGDQSMYDAFYQHNVYPGARLTISHRGSEYEYDIRTRPIVSKQSVTVRRIVLTDDNQLEYWEDEEPLRYEVDGDVFVADARWENLPALFQQAEEAGQGIFGLMFAVCQQWQREQGAPLIVTADELYDPVCQKRLTSKATIAYELWRRQAFTAVGNGRYQFHPEQGDRTRSHGLTARRARSARRSQRPTRSFTRQYRLPTTNFTADDLWAALMADEARKQELQTAVTAYKSHPSREKVLFLRRVAHQRIRDLLAADQLDALTLDDFNQQVWQLGTVSYQNVRARIDTEEIAAQLQPLSLAELEKAVTTHDLIIAGNQTWGSGAGVYGSRLTRLSNDQKRRLLIETVRYLLYDPAPVEQRINRVLKESNGFGINLASGLLHAVYPDDHILYNGRSVEMLTALNVDWPANWRQNGAVYLVYRDFMQRLRRAFDFASLTDVDWFVYGWGDWQTGVGTAVSPTVALPAQSEPGTFWQEINTLQGKPLKTLKRQRPFQLTRVTPTAAHIYMEDVQHEASISRVAMEKAREIIRAKGKLSRQDLQTHFAEDHPQFLAAILDALPYIRAISQTEGESPPAKPTPPPKFETTKSGQLLATNLVPIGPLFEDGSAVPEPAPPATGYFIFQQKPESEYDDQTGRVYNWRQGIPGSRQIQPGARFVYYRPGEQVFFGCGRIEWIEQHEGADGRYTYDGQIRDYEQWKPPLPLTTELAHKLSFVNPQRLGVGQAGIRKISHDDFTTLLNAYRTLSGQPVISEQSSVSSEQLSVSSEQSSVSSEQSPISNLQSPAASEPLPITNTPPTHPPAPNLQPPPAGEDMTKTSKSLFANHYLQRRLPDHPEWQEDPAAALEKLQALYNDKKALLPNFNEAQTERDFLQPVLDVLGFAYTVQTSSSRAGQAQRPDYALFADATQKTAADKHIKDETAFYPRAIAIAEAKYWERPLTKQHADTNRAQFDNRNPSHQIVSYLIGTAVDWGILTNGRFWRLYYRQASSTANEFYEVDLVELLEDGDPEAFKQFWLFFRKEAFVKGKDGRNFLECVRDGSTTYARAVSDQLKERVFAEVFPLLAGGFVADMARRGQDPTGDDARALIQEATLSLLYKLLFLLYAEARDLLPLDNDGYREQSITQLAQEVAAKMDQKATLGQTATRYYGRLRSLFKMIDQGDPALGLPRYNGGLFHFTFADDADREKHKANAFLDRHAINDGRLARALDNLARVDGQPVDYSFLEVRHLGAVYEGLLEYKLVIENAAAGQVHLATDKGERKATGSYYTPDYIVKYIVRHTLDPILQERERRFADLMAQIAPKRARLQSLNLQSPVSQSPAVESRIKNEIYVLRQELPRLEKEAVNALLDIKVCDPAMGSGHFLVEAVDYLTDRLIQILNQHPDHNPILAQLDAIRGSILDSMAAQAIPIDPARLDDTQLLQRTVMKRCIYGVDLNRMAVELAKLSLWLHSFTIGAPLSFLDHHLRWGNSLIGMMARDAAKAMQETKTEKKKSREARLLAQGRGEKTEDVAVGFQFDLFGGPFKGLLRAAEVMRGISSLSDATLAEVAQSEALFHEFDKAAKPYKRLLDVFVAQHFGVKQADDFLRLYGAEVMDAPEEKLGKGHQQVLAQTRALFAQKRFFHWDLEFPEVFIDLDKADWKSNPGFDAVVGNPPYVRQEGLGADKPFFKESYESYNGVADLYVYFLEQGARLLAVGGQFSNIVSNKFMRANYGQGIRKWLTEHTTLRQLVDFGELPVFAEAATFPLIIMFEKNVPEKGQAVQVARIRSLDFASLDKEVTGCAYIVNDLGLLEQGWSLAPEDVTKILQKMESLSIPLGQYTEGQILYGIKTGFNDAFFIDRATRDQLIAADPKSAELIKPLIVGDDVRAYHIHFQERYLIFTRRGIDIENYQAIKAHLGKYRQRLEPRPKYHQETWPGRKPGTYKWYEIQDSIDYWQYFEQPKIVYPVIAREPRFAFDETQHFYTNDKCFIIPRHDLYLLTLLNSRLLFETAKLKVSVLGDEHAGGRLELPAVHLQYLPIRQINFATLSHKRESIVTQAKTHYQQQAYDAVLTWAAAELAANRNDTIHDLLAFLAQEMIRLHQEKQTEINDFLNWLAQYTSHPIDNWALKTIARAYHEKGWDEFKRALFHNAAAIQKAGGPNVKGRKALTHIQKEYEASVATLTPLLARIHATDTLIDQIVYRLYGLTEEEIAIVEGRAQ